MDSEYPPPQSSTPSPMNLTFHTRWCMRRSSGPRILHLEHIWPNMVLRPRVVVIPPRERRRLTCMRLSSITGPCCFPWVMVAFTTRLNADSYTNMQVIHVHILGRHQAMKSSILQMCIGLHVHVHVHVYLSRRHHDSS